MILILKCHICTNCILIVAVVNVVLIHYKNRYWNDSTCQIAKFLFFDVNLDKLDMLLLIRGKSAMDWIEIRIWYMFSNMRKELILQYDHLLFQTWFYVSLTLITSLEIKFPIELLTQSWHNGRYSYVQNFKNLGRYLILDLLVLSALFFKHIFITTLSCVGIIDSFGFWTWQTRLSSFCYNSFDMTQLQLIWVSLILYSFLEFSQATKNFHEGM